MFSQYDCLGLTIVNSVRLIDIIWLISSELLIKESSISRSLYQDNNLLHTAWHALLGYITNIIRSRKICNKVTFNQN